MSDTPDYPTEATRGQFKLRLSHGLHDEIKEAAYANRRSVNSEITARLEASFLPPAFHDEIAALMESMGDPEVSASFQRVIESVAAALREIKATRAAKSQNPQPGVVRTTDPLWSGSADAVPPAGDTRDDHLH